LSYGAIVPILTVSIDVSNGGPPPDYISATGIQKIAFETVQRTDVITPYGAFPTMLADLPTGLAWYLQMLKGPRMQGDFLSLTFNSFDTCQVHWDQLKA
jgi:hypothetical protein